MIYKFLAALDRKVKFPEVHAHCDIPCGIYDPIVAQINALTVVRMLDLMADLDATTGDKLAYHNSMSRYIAVKEEHAEKAKHEIRVIFGDYIKAPHVEKYPELPTLVHKIMMAGSKVRQSTDRAAAAELIHNARQSGRKSSDCSSASRQAARVCSALSDGAMSGYDIAS